MSELPDDVRIALLVDETLCAPAGATSWRDCVPDQTERTRAMWFGHGRPNRLAVIES